MIIWLRSQNNFFSLSLSLSLSIYIYICIPGIIPGDKDIYVKKERRRKGAHRIYVIKGQHHMSFASRRKWQMARPEESSVYCVVLADKGL